MGVVYTPDDIAEAIVKLTVQSNFNGSILEPSVGEGAFIRALLKHNVRLDCVSGIEIDKNKVRILRRKFPELKMRCMDFLKYFRSVAPNSFDLVIGNPPYIGVKNLSDGFKLNLDWLSSYANYPRSALKNAWAAFIVASEKLLSEKGTLAFVVPYELLNVKYGLVLQNEVFSKFQRVDIFVPKQRAFENIDQDAVVIVARKQTSQVGGVYVQLVNKLSQLEFDNPRKIDYLNPKNVAVDLKSFLLDSGTVQLINELRSKCRLVKDHCASSTGIVTAANDFFILNRETVIIYGLQKWSRPILKKSSYLTRGPIFDSECFDIVDRRHPAWLVDFNSMDPENLDEEAQVYIELGEELGLQNSYKAKHRRNWYQVPLTGISSGFFFKRSHAYPRLCINEAEVFVTDTAYQISMKSPYSIKGLCYSFYNSLTLLFAEIDGRFYGGGVLELTPSEFQGLPLLYSEPTSQEFREFSRPQLWTDPHLLAKRGDQILHEKHGIPETSLVKIHEAWKAVRHHRLRHGRNSASSSS